MSPSPFLSLAAAFSRLLPLRLKRGLYRLGPVTRALRGLLNRAAPSGLTEIEIAGGDLRGWRMALDLHSEKDYWLGTYEPELQAAIRSLVRPGWTVYDVGANVGYVTLLLAQAVGEQGRVIAFEALPANQTRWQRNTALNGLEERARLVSAAVTDTEGTTRFLVGPSDDTGKAAGSAGRRLRYTAALQVPCLSLDDFVYARGNPPPALVKMDIEGGEVLALRGMRRLLREAAPLLLLELHGEVSARLAWEELTAAGYLLHRMREGFPRLTSPEALDWKAYLAAWREEA